MCKKNWLQFVDFISFETVFGNTAILAQEAQLQGELALHHHSQLILCVLWCWGKSQPLDAQEMLQESLVIHLFPNWLVH